MSPLAAAVSVLMAATSLPALLWATAAEPPPSVDVALSSVAKGLCSDGARWTVRLTRDGVDDLISADLTISSTRPGGKWQYQGSLETVAGSLVDAMTMTAKPTGDWTAQLLLYVETQPAVRVRFQATDDQGQTCRPRLRQSVVAFSAQEP